MYSSCAIVDNNVTQQQYTKWWLLLHQVPPSPPYLRAKVLRRLNQLGACAIKNSAYLLPGSVEHLEDFQWLKSEIIAGGGEAWIFSVAPGGLADPELQERFRQLRTQDYKQLLDAMSSNPEDWRKLKRKFDEVRAIDFFNSPGREEVESLMRSMEQRESGIEPRKPGKPNLNGIAGATWVTRKGVKVDRISSAWLIRRFIDASARFLFVDESHHTLAPGQIRFDMFEGEFTHEGELCTFEVLVKELARRDAALEAIAQMVHDIDVKDDKYQRPETNGFAAIIYGIGALHASDDQRIEEGARLLDATYAALKGG